MNHAKLQYEGFSPQVIIGRLSKLDITMDSNVVTTSLYDNVIREKEVSDHYHTFDFTNFVVNFISGITDYFTPNKQLLRLDGGKQELRLIGDEVSVNGEQYNKQLIILNSSDKSRALQVHMGLFRMICSNGMVASVPGEYASIKAKHFNNTLPGKVDQFLSSIQNFDKIIGHQVNKIEALNSLQISFTELAQNLSRDAKGEIAPNKIRRVNAFAHKLLTSETDKINTSDFSKRQFDFLKNPELAVYADDKNKVDIMLNGSTAFQCYTEIFRNRDASVLNRETDRILNFLQPNSIEDAVLIN